MLGKLRSFSNFINNHSGIVDVIFSAFYFLACVIMFYNMLNFLKIEILLSAVKIFEQQLI